MKFSTIHSCLSSNSNSPHFTLKFLKLFVCCTVDAAGSSFTMEGGSSYIGGLACTEMPHLAA